MMPTASRPMLAVAALLATLAVASAQSEPPKGATRVSPGGTTRVFVMAGFDKDCRTLAMPAIEIVAPPAKGTVTFREGQTTTVQYSLSGSCVGAKVQGVGIYYTAGAAAEGDDTFTISARLGSGEAATRTFRLRISDQ